LSAAGALDPRKSECLIFLDESGTPNYLDPNEYSAWVRTGKANFPIRFGLGAVLVRRDRYFRDLDPAFRALKVKHFGSDLPMHEYDLKQRNKPFDVLRSLPQWQAFASDIDALFRTQLFSLLVVAVHKPEMQTKYLRPYHPYHYALEIIVERTAMESKNFGWSWRIVAEDREKGLNGALQNEMLRLQLEGCGSAIEREKILVDAAEVRRKFHPEIEFRQKKDNDTGLQLADLTVGPVLRHIYGLDGSERRTLRGSIIPKLCRAKDGKLIGFGVKCFPEEPAGCPL
jgi:Protein of unknown function (DUF3800)